jgi:hypothetical protein
MLHLKTRTGYNGSFLWLDNFLNPVTQQRKFRLSMIDKIDQINKDALDCQCRLTEDFGC